MIEGVTNTRDSHSGIPFETSTSTSRDIINTDDINVQMMIMCWE